MQRHKWFDYLVVMVVGVILFLPGLGQFALWEEDEAHNAECAREMLEADTWIVPTFNFALRTDKPPLQYWCIQVCYRLFGVSEWSARFPSACASLLTLITVYELGRAFFNRTTGLLASLILGSSIFFSVASHAVTPDAFLILTTLLTFAIFAGQYESKGQAWFILTGLTSGLAVLAKGPVGLVLPAAIILVFLFWERQWQRLLNRHLLFGSLLFLVIALPWYILVGMETRWAFWRGFFMRHNLDRFMNPMEGHRGGVWYHPTILLLAMIPWSTLIVPVLWNATKAAFPCKPDDNQNAWWKNAWKPTEGDAWKYRFLGCWITIWVTVFSLAATKLPNYILPVYPALAILTARLLDRWMSGSVLIAPWVWRTILLLFLMIGVGCGIGLILCSDEVNLTIMRGRVIPHLSPWAVLGLPLVIGAVTAWYCWRRQWRAQTIYCLMAGSISWIALLGALGTAVIDEARAPKALAHVMSTAMFRGDMLLGCHGRYHPSMVFYTRRLLQRSLNDQDAIDLLQCPWPAFLIVAEKDWVRLSRQLKIPTQILSSHYDFQAGQNLLLISNLKNVDSTSAIMLTSQVDNKMSE